MDDGWNDDATPVVSHPQTYRNGSSYNAPDDGWDETPIYESQVYSNRTNYRAGGGGGGGNRRNDRNDFQQNRRGNNFERRNEEAKIIYVPTRFVGKIIGKKGANINNLQMQSGAKINVMKNADGDQTEVKLIGDEGVTAKAEELINELITERRDDGGRPSYNNYADRADRQPQSQNRADNEWSASAPSEGSRYTSNYGDRSSQSQNRDNQWSAAVSTSNGKESEPAGQDNQKDWCNFDFKAALDRADALEMEEWSKLPLIQKEFYDEHPDVTAMTEQEVEEFRVSNNNIVVDRTFKSEDSKPVHKPVRTFDQAFHNYPEILEQIAKAGFEKPSPIQCQAWPVLLSGEDLIGIAQTGTGKTLAFLLPALIHIQGQLTTRQERIGPAVLIMAPTRELALQIEKEAKKYEYKGINAACIYGGGSRRDQIKVVTQGIDIVIATPGRLNDLREAGYLNLKYVTYAVLDEADRMLDMGFEPEIRKIMYGVRPTRQTVMTSATWPFGVRRLAQTFMNNPVQIYVGSMDLTATHTVQQIIEMLPDDDQAKMDFFMDFARSLKREEKIIVFCSKKARASHLCSDLSLLGFEVDSLHGDKEQCDRERAVADIKAGTIQILVATDLASRGLDIDDITHVINYDFPKNIEEYVHRVGRTGRAGKLGKAISYFTRENWALAGDLIKILQEANQPVAEELVDMAERFEARKLKADAQPWNKKPRYGGGNNRSNRW